MIFVDTHCHLNSDKLYNNLEEIIKEAIESNVKLIIVPGFDFETSKIAIEIANKYPFVYCTIGFHPTEIKNYTYEHYNWLDENASNKKVVAIGEIGYDFYWDTTTKEEQTISFKKQLLIAKKHNLPVVIHSRDAINYTYETLKEMDIKSIGGVMHSYSGSVEMAKKFIDLNMYLGISGPVTFLNAVTPKEVVKNIDITHLITETDSPYLTPHPYRGKTNTPSKVVLVYEKIQELKNISIENIQDAVLANTLKLFKIGDFHEDN